MEFSEWITRKYVQWRGDAIGRERSVPEFADWLEINPKTVDHWINGRRKRPRDPETIQKLIDKYDDEVYAILGIDPPERKLPSPEDATFADWIRLLKQLPEKDREELLASARARLPIRIGSTFAPGWSSMA